MTTPSPAEQFTTDLHFLQSKIGDLQKNARLSNISDTIEDVQTSVNSMAQRIADIRQRGYVFEKELEAQAAGFVAQFEIGPNYAFQTDLFFYRCRLAWVSPFDAGCTGWHRGAAYFWIACPSGSSPTAANKQDCHSNCCQPDKMYRLSHINLL